MRLVEQPLIFCARHEGQITGFGLLQPRDAPDFELAVPFEPTLKSLGNVAEFHPFAWQDAEYNMRPRGLIPDYTPVSAAGTLLHVFDRTRSAAAARGRTGSRHGD